MGIACNLICFFKHGKVIRIHVFFNKRMQLIIQLLRSLFTFLSLEHSLINSILSGYINLGQYKLFFFFFSHSAASRQSAAGIRNPIARPST